MRNFTRQSNFLLHIRQLHPIYTRLISPIARNIRRRSFQNIGFVSHGVCTAERNMKIIFALAVFGVACAWATPLCDDTEANKCIRTQDWETGQYPETVERLEEFCRDALEELDCTLEFIDRCPNTMTGFLGEGVKEERQSFGRICDPEDSMRQTYLDNVSCLNEHRENVEEECSETVTVEEFCERNTALEQCEERRIQELCSEGGKELFTKIYGPKYTGMRAFCEE